MTHGAFIRAMMPVVLLKWSACCNRYSLAIAWQYKLNLLWTCVFFTSVDCGPPVTPLNGSLESYTNTTEGSEVFYSCNQGLVPEGRMRAVCTRNGWSPNPAAICCTEGMHLHDWQYCWFCLYFVIFLLQVLSCAHVPPAMSLQ